MMHEYKTHVYIYHLAKWIFILASLVTASRSPLPVGITFQSSRIYAAYFTSSGSIDVVKLPVSGAYEAYYHDAILNYGRRFLRRGKWYTQEGQDIVAAPPDTHDEEDVKRMFQATLNQVKENLAASLSRPYKIMSLTIPSIFNDSSYAALALTVFPNGLYADDGPFHRSAAASSAMFAYGLDRCETFGRSAAECALGDDIANLALVVEYEKEYLHLSLRHGGENEPVFPLIESTMATNLGEESAARQNMRPKEYQEQVRRRISEHIASVVNGGREYERDDIRAVVLVGEVSSKAMSEIKNITAEALSNFRAKVFDSVDPAIVVAYGQAHFARDVMRYPRAYGGIPYKASPPEEGEHDEL